MSLDRTIAHVQASIDAAWKHDSEIPDVARNWTDASSEKVRCLLHNICHRPGTIYLEAGVWVGSSLVCSLLGNEQFVERAYAIDNWSMASQPYPDDTGRAEFARNRKLHLSKYGNRLTVFDEDVYGFDPNKIDQRANVFYFDADHEKTIEGVIQLAPAMVDTCILILDDFHIFNIDKKWRAAVDDLPFTIECEWELPNNHRRDAKLWWCGFYVAVVTRK